MCPRRGANYGTIGYSARQSLSISVLPERCDLCVPSLLPQPVPYLCSIGYSNIMHLSITQPITVKSFQALCTECSFCLQHPAPHPPPLRSLGSISFLFSPLCWLSTALHKHEGRHVASQPQIFSADSRCPPRWFEWRGLGETHS